MGCHFAAVGEMVSRPDGSRQGDRAIQAVLWCISRGRRAAVFLVCPLMCEIWAFRYFWPNPAFWGNAMTTSNSSPPPQNLRPRPLARGQSTSRQTNRLYDIHRAEG
jgi:hypothetical protein